MVEEFIKLFTGLRENFGKADMATAKVDPDTTNLKPVYQWAKEIKATEVHLDYQFSDDSEKIERFYKRLGYVPLGKRFKKEVIEE